MKLKLMRWPGGGALLLGLFAAPAALGQVGHKCVANCGTGGGDAFPIPAFPTFSFGGNDDDPAAAERRRQAQRAARKHAQEKQARIDAEEKAKEDNDHQRLQQELMGADSVGSTSELQLLDGEPVRSRTPSENAVNRTVKAIDCAVAAILELSDNGELSADGLRADLAEIRNGLSQPLSGADDSATIQSVSFSSSKKDGADEKELVGQLLVTRNEKTGEVHVDVMQLTSRKAGPFSRLFGDKASTKNSQSLMVLDDSGNIVAKEVSGQVKKCLRSGL